MTGRWTGEPFVFGTREQFACARDFLRQNGYTEEDLSSSGGVSSIYELPGEDERKTLLDETDPQSLLVRLFLDGTRFPWSTVRRTLGAEVKALESLELLQTSHVDSDACSATVALYPNEGLYVASDKHHKIDDVAEGVPGDIVYSAMTRETHRFVELMPRVPCEAYLELCSGTGIAALIAARKFAERTWAVDITERSTRFAQFNAAFNEVENCVVLEGDLYAPVAGQTFDMISAHPPYVPSFETEMVFRDGGEDGEQVTRRILAGLADHLRPGGQFWADCMMTDRDGARLEDRIRSMLGPSEAEFDVVLGQGGTLAPEEFFARTLRTGTMHPEDFDRRRKILEQLGVERFVTALFMVQRRATTRPVFTRRRVVSTETSAADFQWYLRWSTATAEPMSAEQFLNARPVAAPGVELRSRSIYQNGGWTAADTMLVTRRPFALEATCPSWFATLLSWCDGQRTAREHLQRLREEGVIAESGSESEFAFVIGRLADGGFVELDFAPRDRPSSPSSSLDG
jgi:methylase of polypeptide subunit release factors